MTSAAISVVDVAAFHSSESSEWYTPPIVVEPAREVLGGIDLDPCGCRATHDALVKPSVTLRLPQDGLGFRWTGSVFVNPPSPPREWWTKLTRHYASGDVPMAIYVAYSVEQLQQSQVWAESTGLLAMTSPQLAGLRCIPKRRVPYLQTVRDALVNVEKRIVKAVSKTKKPEKALLTKRDWLKTLRPDAIVAGEQPSHSSAIVGLGLNRAAFAQAFGSLGDIW